MVGSGHWRASPPYCSAPTPLLGHVAQGVIPPARIRARPVARPAFPGTTPKIGAPPRHSPDSPEVHRPVMERLVKIGETGRRPAPSCGLVRSW